MGVESAHEHSTSVSDSRTARRARGCGGVRKRGDARRADALMNVAAQCPDQTLLTPDGGGFIFDKLTDSPACGSQMPVGGDPLTPGERQCLRDYLMDGGQ